MLEKMLKGIDVKPSCNADVRKLIGKRVKYLCKCDIDRSGRWYFFPRHNTITEAYRKNIIFATGDSIYISDLVEMVLDEEI